MMDLFNIRSVIQQRSSQPSFHVVAEKHVRIEFRNLAAGEQIGPFIYGGDIVVTCYVGRFRLECGTKLIELSELDQVVVPQGVSLAVVCTITGTFQLIWSPAQAQTVQQKR